MDNGGDEYLKGEDSSSWLGLSDPLTSVRRMRIRFWKINKNYKLDYEQDVRISFF